MIIGAPCKKITTDKKTKIFETKDKSTSASYYITLETIEYKALQYYCGLVKFSVQ